MRLQVGEEKHNPYHRTTNGHKANIKLKCQSMDGPFAIDCRDQHKGRLSGSVTRTFLNQWGWGSLAETLPSTLEALCLNPQHKKSRREGGKERDRDLE